MAHKCYLKPVYLSRDAMVLLLVVYNTKPELGFILNQPAFNKQYYLELIEAGLVKTGSDAIYINETGKGAVTLFPAVIRTGKCHNCGSEQGIVGEEAIKVLFEEPSKTCSTCGTELFKQTKPDL